jgi:hypothetical protein
VTVRAPQSFSEERTRQVLRHISTAVFHFVKTKVDEEQEIQAMYVNERVFLSSNLPGSMAALRGLSAAELTNIFLSSNYMPASDPRAARSAQKLIALVQGTRIDDITFDDQDQYDEVANIAGLISGLAENPANYLSHCTVDQAKNFIDDDAHLLHVILVEGLRPVHAEQNLILAYCNSGSSSQAVVYGKKRPCTGCYLTFMYARQVLGKSSLVFNENPGGFWSPAVRGLWDLISTQKGLAVADIENFVAAHLPEETFRSARSGSADEDESKMRTDTKNEDTGYDTESDTDDM